MDPGVKLAFEAAGQTKFLMEVIDEQGDFSEFIRPYFTHLLDRTINMNRLATALFNSGTISHAELTQCLADQPNFLQNLEVYRTVIKKNAGRPFIDALYKSGNFQMIKLLHSKVDPLNFPDNLSLRQVVILEKDSKVRETDDCDLEKDRSQQKDHENDDYDDWINTVRAANLAVLQEDSMDYTLIRVVTTGAKVDPANAREYFEPCECHPEERLVMTKFLEYSIHLELENSRILRPPREIYINARSFNREQWERVSTMLDNFCRDSLEHFWLEQVTRKIYLKGTKWMKRLDQDRDLDKPKRFTRLKSFIWQGDLEEPLNAEMFNKILLFIKRKDCPLSTFWKESGVQVQVWKRSKSCQVLMDPSKGIVCLNEVENTLKDQIDLCLLSDPKSSGKTTSKSISISKSKSTSKSSSVKVEVNVNVMSSSISQTKVVPLTKLYYLNPRASLFKSGTTFQQVTHLFLKGQSLEGQRVVQEVMGNLPRFKVLKKLQLCNGPDGAWTVALKQLNGLDKLQLIHLTNAQVNCGGHGVDLYPWRQSVQTVILNRCLFKMKTLELQAVDQELVKDLTQKCGVLERNKEQNVGKSGIPFKISVLSLRDAGAKILREFFD